MRSYKSHKFKLITEIRPRIGQSWGVGRDIWGKLRLVSVPWSTLGRSCTQPRRVRYRCSGHHSLDGFDGDDIVGLLTKKARTRRRIPRYRRSYHRLQSNTHRWTRPPSSDPLSPSSLSSSLSSISPQSATSTRNTKIRKIYICEVCNHNDDWWRRKPNILVLKMKRQKINEQEKA